MRHIPKPMPLADPKRFRTIQDLTRLRPDCGAAIDDILVIDNECLLIIDLANAGSLLSPYNSPSAYHVKMHGVMVESYIHSETIPILWREPILLLPLSHHLKGVRNICNDTANIVGRISSPSGTFLMLPLRTDIPTLLNKGLIAVLAAETGAKVILPNGTYRMFYEQFDTPEGAREEDYRNIVVQKQ